MNLEDTATEIERMANELTRGVPAELSIYLKDQFEKFLPQFLGGFVKAEMRVVLDASSAVSEVLAFVKNGNSMLISLAKEPFLRLYAPHEIVPEVEKALLGIARKRKMDAERLLNAWRVNLLPVISLQKTESLGAWFRSMFIMAKRDVKDVPYVALSFDFQMHGVVSRDLDILDQPQVRTWRLSRIREVVTVMKKGSLMFVASSEILYPIFLAVFKFAITFLRAVFHICADVASAIGQVIKGAVTEIKKRPDWAKLAIAFAAVLAIQDERVRQGLRSIGKTIADFLESLINAIHSVIQLLAPLIEIPIAIALVLIKNVGEAIVQLRNLSSGSLT